MFAVKIPRPPTIQAGTSSKDKQRCEANLGYKVRNKSSKQRIWRAAGTGVEQIVTGVIVSETKGKRPSTRNFEVGLADVAEIPNLFNPVSQALLRLRLLIAIRDRDERTYLEVPTRYLLRIS